MGFVVVCVVWWLSGLITLLYQYRDRPLTYGGLVGFGVLSVIGPTMMIAVILSIIIEAPFWTKPVFNQAKRKER